MKEYPLADDLVKIYKFSLAFFCFSFLLMMISWFTDSTPKTGWFAILGKILGVLCWIFLIINYTINIREPGIKIGDKYIEVKIDQSLNFWKTTWANLSHIEVRNERRNNIVPELQYEYVCFKQPVTRDFIFLGLKLWRSTKKGFRLDVFDESARTEIKARLSSSSIFESQPSKSQEHG